MGSAVKRATEMVSPVHAVRLANLKHIIKTRFEENATACGRAIGRSHTYLWQLLNGRRAIGEASARLIEQKLKLGDGKLDEHRGMMTRSKVLTAHLGNGEMQNYHLVPRVILLDIDTLTKIKPIEVRPCPIGCSEATVFFPVTSESMEPLLRVGELAFADPGDRELVHSKLYVVRPKGKGCSWQVRQAKQRDHGIVLEAARSKEKSYEASQVTVYGRVIHIMRDC